MKKLLSLCLIVLIGSSVYSQTRYMTRTGNVKFFSETPAENIDAVNNQVSSILEKESGRLVFQIPLKGFAFEKALMQEHFNENYVESDKYPKATFDGLIENLTEIDLTKAGTYDVNVSGTLTMHGVSKEVSEKGSLTVNEDGSIEADSKFMLRPEDYAIEIPGMVRDKIAKEVEVTVDLLLKKAS